MKCPECGHELPDTVNFCSNCGASLRTPIGDTTRVIPAVSTEDTGRIELTESELAALRNVPTGTGVLLVVRGPNDGATFLLDREVVTAGRHPQCDIFLDDVTVSRRHVEIERTSSGYVVRDIGSLNGTYLNGALVEGDAPMANGDELQVGRFKLVYVAGSEG